MKLVVGLGNPGIEYKETKHNIGFEVVKAFAKEHGIKLNKRVNFSLIGKGRVAGEDIVVVLPQTYMNLSGNAVGEIVAKHTLDLGDLVVVCDDINLELGKIRLRAKGSSGGQKGLESIIHTLGTDNFPRLRVGIATDAHRGDITHYVLSPFKRKERRNVLHVTALAKDALTFLMKEGTEKTMAKFNKRRVGTS